MGVLANIFDQWSGYNTLVRDRRLIEEAKRANDLKEREIKALEKLAQERLLSRQQRLGPEFEQVLHDNLWELYAR